MNERNPLEPHVTSQQTVASVVSAIVAKTYRQFVGRDRGSFHVAKICRAISGAPTGWGVYSTAMGLRYRLNTAVYPDFHMAPGLFELSTERVFRRLLGLGCTFVDVGANIGYFTAIGASIVGPAGRVHAFEPDPENLLRLSENLELNGISYVQVHRCGLSDKCGSAELFHPDISHGESSLFVRKGKGRIHAIELKKFDDVISEDVHLVKVDIEGGEMKCFLGMEDSLASNRVHALLFEVNPMACQAAGYSPTDLLDLLRRLNPKLSLYDSRLNAVSHKLIERLRHNQAINLLALQ